ncbi:MAG: HD domain-containing protein, partial [Desulfovibrionaceae bacterium]|nr:HD domain-containing protein [Desulfovibrionaceae bacterium]
TRSGNRFSPLEWFGFSDEQELYRIVDCSLFKEVVRSGKAEIVNELDQDPRWDCDLPSIRALLVLPLTSPNACQGCLVLASGGGSPFDSGHLKSLSVLAAVAGIALGNASNFEGIQTLMAAMLQALAEAIDSRDPYTAGHSERVALLVVAFAQLLNDDRSFPDIQFSEDQVREIYYAGILHDVGKIGVREDVLTKHRRVPEKLMEIIRLRLEMFGVENRSSWIEDYERLKGINASTVTSPEDREFILELSRRYLETDGRTLHVLSRDERDSFLVHRGNLTLEERQEIERHPAESQRILQHIPFRKDFQDLLTIIRQHHERLDGSGYPDGLRGEDILVQSRMLSIVDIYDAIIQERHYKSASSKDQALSIIEDEAREGKLDHRLVQAFVRRIEEIEARAYSLGIEQLQTLSGLHARTQGEVD